ncbi:MAG: preprotein translocase subunit SecG [Desulfovibrio sp.]|nr:preprotein translocase subunit SecG [Desulfovibrio sp.]
MQTLILTLHIIVCVMLVILVLLQAGKEGMGVIFGGGNSSVFGSSGAGGMLAKLTAFMAVIFVATSLSYTFVTSPRPKQESTILDVKIEEPAPASGAASPAKPEAAPEQTGASAPSQSEKSPGQAGNEASAKPDAMSPEVAPATPAVTPAKPAAEPIKPAAEPAKPAARTPGEKN